MAEKIAKTPLGIQSKHTDSKRAQGRFYTLGNPFTLKPFRRWAKRAGIPGVCILEPFAGANHIIHTLSDLDLCKDFISYDINPNNNAVKKRNTIERFPKGYKVCVTNPPWLARNSATRRGLPYPQTAHDDLYKHCLELCLHNCRYVAALIPASYLQSGLFRERLHSYILLHKTIFNDTENPVCLALFDNKTNGKVWIYADDCCIGTLNALESSLPEPKRDKKIRFNDPNGQLGFISFDNTREPSIRFCRSAEIKDYQIKHSSRFITRIGGEFKNLSALIKKLNRKITSFREDTEDIFLTPFKGIRSDGRYRRRMDFNLARRFINST
ncbi:MAG: hypothetical protein GDA45_02330 [Chromatiales bacterium]|nr:hypothetical protein [Chromatiales bacterium]